MGDPITHSLVKALQALPDFMSLDNKTLLSIVGTSMNLYWPEGSFVFEKDHPGDALYIVLSGVVRVIEPVEGNNIEVDRIGAGQFFGELSLLLNTTHSKTAQALTDTELMVIPKASFDALLSSNPNLKAHFQQVMREKRVPLTPPAVPAQPHPGND